MPEWLIDDLSLTNYPYSVDADSTVDIGEPEMIVESITSQLADGEIEREVRHGNRTYVLTVYIEGPTLGDVAESAAELRRALRRRGALLTHDPGDGLTPASVYEISTARLTPERNDTHESHLLRKFTITLTCAPFARSATETVVAAMPTAATTPTLIDNCSSATGWTATVNGVASAPTVISGSLRAQDSTEPKSVVMRRDESVVFGSQRYLIAEVLTNQWPVAAFAKMPSGARELPRISSRLLPSGWTQCVFDTDGETAADLSFAVSSPVRSSAPLWLWVNDVSKATTPPQTSPRQVTRGIVPDGTERTPVSLHVSSANGTDPLDVVVVHTCPEDGSGYAPSMRRWRVSGNTVTTTFDAMSGAYEPIHPNPFRAEVPNMALPEGGYIIAARMSTDTPGTHRVAWSASTIAPFGGANLVGEIEDVTFFNANQWIIAPLAFVSLPTIATTGTGVVTRIDVQRYSGTALINVDEVFLFRAEDDCALTIVGGVPAHVWLDAAGAGDTEPMVWLSGTGSRDNMRHPADTLLAGDSHILHPEGTAVFVAAVSDNPAVEARFHARHHSNAAS